MAMTVIGLLYIQIMYMESMIRMRDDQFTEGVRRSLYAVSSLLEQDETKYFLEEDVAQVESSSIYPVWWRATSRRPQIQFHHA